MVSKASDDLPEPESPVMTMSLLRGSSTSMFLRLCSRAPLTTILSMSGPQRRLAPLGADYHITYRSPEVAVCVRAEQVDMTRCPGAGVSEPHHHRADRVARAVRDVRAAQGEVVEAV